MSQKPSKVVVGPHEYKILYSKQSWKKYNVHKNNDAVGLCLVGRSVILIKSWALSKSQIKDCVLHEILHATFGLTVFETQPYVIPDNKHDIEELAVLLLTPTLLQIMRDNSKLFDWLTASD